MNFYLNWCLAFLGLVSCCKSNEPMSAQIQIIKDSHLGQLRFPSKFDREPLALSGYLQKI